MVFFRSCFLLDFLQLFWRILGHKMACLFFCCGCFSVVRCVSTVSFDVFDDFLC